MAADKGSPEQFDEEINKYLDILAKDPQSRAFAPLAEAYRKAGLLDQAIETSREGLKHHPSYFGGRVALGRALFEKGLFSEAKDEFVQVVQAVPDNLMAQKLLGQAWQQLGNAAEAEKAFRMVLLLDPRDEEAQRSLDGLTGAPPAPPAAFEPPPVTTAPAEPEGREEAAPATAEAVQEPEAAPTAAPSGEEEEVPAFVVDEEEDETAAGEDTEPVLVFEEAAEEAPPEEVPAPAGAQEEEGKEQAPVSSEPVFDLADLEAMAKEAEREEEERGDETGSPFEVFTREPEREPPPQVEREETVKAEEPFERTFEAEDLGEEEIPEFDLFEDVEAVAEEALPPPPAPPAPFPSSAEEEAHADLESEMDVLDLAEEPETPTREQEAPVTPETGSAVGPEGEGEGVTDLEDEIPTFDLAAEVASVTAPPEEPPAAGGLEEGTFDTETLARLYVSQGFYEKAANVYRRMLQDRPGDAGLRQKLEEVLSLQKMETAEAAPPAPEPPSASEVAAAPAPAATAEAAPEEENPVIAELQRFLAQLKERGK